MINLYLNGKEICASKATYAPLPVMKEGERSREGIKAMSACDIPIPVKKGDVVTMESIYDLEQHPL